MATNLYFRRFRRAVRNTISFVHGLGIGTATLFKGLEGMRAYATSMQERLEATQKEILKSEENVMFVTIGLALTTWARMEEALVRIVQILLSAPGPKVGLIMYSIINFNAWLTIIDELYALEPRLAAFKPRWNKVARRIRKSKTCGTGWLTSQRTRKWARLARSTYDHLNSMSEPRLGNSNRLPTQKSATSPSQRRQLQRT
jgi:hypothetical protein